MSIKTNHSLESLTPESGVLKIDASGAVALPVGPESDRPVVSAAGYIRFATDITTPEYYDGAVWQTVSNKEYVDNSVGNAGSSLSDVIANLGLDDLVDVDVTNKTNGQVLAYDLTLGQFTPQTQGLFVTTKTFVADGVTSSFDLQLNASSAQNLVVSVNGIQQEPFYSFNLIENHIVSFDEVPEAGDRIQVKVLKSNATTDRPRPRITAVSYSQIDKYTTITIVATDLTYGTGAKIGGQSITRIDYPTANTLQLMIETSSIVGPLWSSSQDLTLVDTSGNEFVFTNLINVGASKPYWTDSNSYIGSYSGGDTINFTLGVNNATSLILSPAYAGETAITWLSVSGSGIVGTAPTNSSPSRYEIKVTASNGSVDITKNYWLLVI
jgi:hypothetical protein